MNQSHDEDEANHRENANDKRQLIFSRGSRICQHATSPLCRPTLGGSAAKRCFTNLVHTIGHRKNLPISEVTQWHEQSTRVTFRCSAGDGTKTPHNHRRWPRTITNSCQSSSAAPSHLGGGNLMRTWHPCIWLCLAHGMEGKESSKGVQVKKEAWG